MTVVPTPVEAHPRTEFRPVASHGAFLGAGLAVASFAMATVLVASTAATASSTRSLAIALALMLASVAVVAVFGAVQTATLKYALGRTGLEVRTAIGWIRVRYDQIDAVEGGAASERLPVLWPGALFGYTAEKGLRPSVARATTTDPARRVLVAGGRGEAVIMTPVDPSGLKTALIDRARTAVRGPRAAAPIGPSWLDRVSSADVWFRCGSVVALFIAALDLTVEVSRTTAAPRHAFAAVAVIAANTLLGYTLLSRFPGAARLLVGTTLCGQVIAMLW